MDIAKPKLKVDIHDIDSEDRKHWCRTRDKVIEEGRRLYTIWRSVDLYDKETRDLAAEGFKTMVMYSNYLLCCHTIPVWTEKRRKFFAKAHEALAKGEPLPKKLQRLFERSQMRDVVYKKMLLMDPEGQRDENVKQHPAYRLVYGDSRGSDRLTAESDTHCVARCLLSPDALVRQRSGGCVPTLRYEPEKSLSVIEELRGLGYRGVDYRDGIGFQVDYSALLANDDNR